MAGAGYRLYTAGQVLTAAQVNTYLMEQSVMVFATSAARDAALTSIKSEGNVTYQLDNNDLDIYNGSSFSTLVAPTSGALTSWTPTVTQSGSVTVTNTYSRYMRVGRMITAWFSLAVTGSGTAANAIVIGALPATAAQGGIQVGGSEIFDSSGAAGFSKYAGLLYLESTTTLTIRDGMSVHQSDNRLGTSTGAFSLGLANGDTLAGWCTYEAGADA